MPEPASTANWSAVPSRTVGGVTAWALPASVTTPSTHSAVTTVAHTVRPGLVGWRLTGNNGIRFIDDLSFGWNLLRAQLDRAEHRHFPRWRPAFLRSAVMPERVRRWRRCLGIGRYRLSDWRRLARRSMLSPEPFELAPAAESGATPPPPDEAADLREENRDESGREDDHDQ